MKRLQKQTIRALIYWTCSKEPENRLQRTIANAYSIFKDTFHNPNNRSETLKKLYKQVYDHITRMDEK